MIITKVFGNTADFWLNLQRRNDIWTAVYTPNPAKPELKIED
jgi:plasmid maintenance system antidote protein VapI